MKETKTLKAVIMPVLTIAALLLVLTGCGIFLPSIFGSDTTTVNDTTSGTSESGVTTRAATVQSIPDGTYTYFPRLRGIINGLEINSYLDKIVVRSGNMNFYIVDRPIAGGGPYYSQSTRTGWSGVLQDLDHPQLAYNSIKVTNDDSVRATIVTFQNVSATRFSLNFGNDGVFFEEVIIGAPDVDLGLPLLRNGTYTFFPRPQAIASGKDINSYLDKIVVRAGFANFYITDTPTGGGGVYYGQSTRTGWSGVLQDLDHPQLAYDSTTRVQYDDSVRAAIVTFQNMSATRFSLNFGDDSAYFEEIIIGEPDA